jgi:hypothetical protein
VRKRTGLGAEGEGNARNPALQKASKNIILLHLLVVHLLLIVLYNKQSWGVHRKIRKQIFPLCEDAIIIQQKSFTVYYFYQKIFRQTKKGGSGNYLYSLGDYKAAGSRKKQ